METLLPLRPALRHSLSKAARWFHGMTDPSTHRLHYMFNPGHNVNCYEDRSSPIRDIGTAADLAVLSAATGSHRFDPVTSSTLQHYEGMLTRHAGPPEAWCHLASGPSGLGEPSSVAHSAMMLLALAGWEGHPQEETRRHLMAELAAGILHQQRPDGTIEIHFEPMGRGLDADAGWQLYGGEAAFALATAYARLQDGRLLRGASAALRAYQAKYRRGEVDPGEIVFFANWQCCASAVLHAHRGDRQKRRWVAGYLRELQHDIISGQTFYEDVKRDPQQQATVEVACALEGLVHCLQVSLAEAASEREAAAAGDAGAQASAEDEEARVDKYAACARVAVAFLLEAQVREGEGVPAAAVGGFPHTLRPGAGQRVDVTGHVCCAFVKLLELLDAHAPAVEE